MRTSVFKIEKNDINRARYLNLMNSWNKHGNYKINREDSLYAVAFGEVVLAGASVNMSDNRANILFLNNSHCHEEEVKIDGTTQLSNLLDEEYGSIDKVIQYVKR